MFGGSLLFNLLMGARVAAVAGRRARRGALSHGERARVWIARALLQRAEAVVIDEGQGTLDPTSLRRVQEVLREEEAGVLVIAHP